MDLCKKGTVCNTRVIVVGNSQLSFRSKRFQNVAVEITVDCCLGGPWCILETGGQ